MPNFVVDPILCVTPETGADPSEVSRWLKAVDAWLAALEGSPFEWRHFFKCTKEIEKLGRLPTFESLRAAGRVTELEVNVPSLLQRLARFFQNEARDLYNVTVTQCAVITEPEPGIVPPELLSRNISEVRIPFQDGLLCLACDKAVGESFAKEARLVTVPFAKPVREISIKGTLGDSEPEAIVTRLGSTAIDERFPVILSPDALSVFFYEALLAGGEDGFCKLVDAITASTYPGSSAFASRIGSQLWQSLHKTGIIEDRFATEKLLRICAAVLADGLDLMNVDRRPKRKTQAPDGPPQTRESDKAKAWRLTITKAGAGYRLHYWHIPARGDMPEQIEFANVLRETDPVVIPDA